MTSVSYQNCAGENYCLKPQNLFCHFDKYFIPLKVVIIAFGTLERQDFSTQSTNNNIIGRKKGAHNIKAKDNSSFNMLPLKLVKYMELKNIKHVFFYHFVFVNDNNGCNLKKYSLIWFVP